MTGSIRTAGWILKSLVFLPFVVGCGATDPKSHDEAGAYAPKEGITAIRSNDFFFDWETEIDPVRADLEGCVADAVSDRFPDLRYIPREAFCDAAFPNLPQGAAPLDLKSMSVLLDNEQFRKRLDSLNMRYIVYVSGYTEIHESHAWELVGGYMAATAIGMSEWSKSTDASAIVFDLKHRSESARAAAHTSGTSWVAGIFPFILGAPADTEGRACRAVGVEVVSTIEAARTAERQR